MKKAMIKLAMFAIATLAFLPASWSQEFNYASYDPTTLQDIIAEEQDHSHGQVEVQKVGENIQLECQVVKFRVVCSYSNIRRPIAESKKNMIRLWMETLKLDTKLASIYQQEIEVVEENISHWIPVQEQVFPYLSRELEKNDPIELFIILLGTVESEYVFIATEFEKPVSQVKNPFQATASTHAAP